MPFGILNPQEFLNWLGQQESLRPKPGMTQYMAGQPQTPVPGESRIGFGVRSGLFNGLNAADQALIGMQNDVAKALAFATAPALPPAQAATPAPPPPAAAQPFAAGGQPELRRTSATSPAGNIFAFTRVPGDRETSGFRSPKDNQRVDGVPNSFHMRRDTAGNPMATDRVPPRGMEMGAFASELRRLNPHLDVINEGDHVHMEPKPGGAGVQGMRQAMQVAGFQGPPAPNYGGLKRADELYQTIGDLQMQPFSAKYTPQEMPELPTPELQAPVDWSKGDALLESARPQNPFGASEEEQKKAMSRMSRAGLLNGLARAVAGFNGNEGLGATLARVGGMMLAGRLQGNQDIQDKMDEFEGAMQKYNIAMAGREDGKAQNAANVANQNIQTMNQFARDKWGIAVKEMQKFDPRMENGVLITYDTNPETGEVTETHTPMDPSRRAASLYGRANIAQAAGNMANEFELMNYKFNQGVASAVLPFVMQELGAQGDANGRNAALGVGLYESADALVNMGQWENLMSRLPNGAAVVQQMKADAYKQAGIRANEEGMPLDTMNESQKQAVDNYIVSSMVPTLVNMGKMHWLVGGDVQDVDPKTGKPRPGTRKANPAQETVSAVEAFRARDRRTSIRTNPKGQQTITESYDGR